MNTFTVLLLQVPLHDKYFPWAAASAILLVILFALYCQLRPRSQRAKTWVERNVPFLVTYFLINLILVGGFAWTLEQFSPSDSYFMKRTWFTRFFIFCIAALIALLVLVFRGSRRYLHSQIPDGSGMDKDDITIPLKVLTVVCGGVALLYLLTHYHTAFEDLSIIHSNEESFSFTENSQRIAATISGILGSIIALSAAYLTFQAFRLNARQGVINRFNELLKWHRENLKDMKKDRVDGGAYVGRRLFTEFFAEYRLAYRLIDGFFKEDVLPHREWVIQNLAVMVFYFGVEDKSIWEDTPYMYCGAADDVKDKERRLKLRDFLLEKVGGKPHSFSNARNKSYRIRVMNSEGDFKVYEMMYKPLQGHQSRLGHYFRHLLSIIKMIERNSDLDPNYFVRVVRQQLGNYEQAMLYLNATSLLGLGWIRHSHLNVELYNLLHNLPVTLMEFGMCARVEVKKSIVEAGRQETDTNMQDKKVIKVITNPFLKKAFQERLQEERIAPQDFEWDEAKGSLKWMLESLDKWEGGLEENYKDFFHSAKQKPPPQKAAS